MDLQSEQPSEISSSSNLGIGPQVLDQPIIVDDNMEEDATDSQGQITQRGNRQEKEPVRVGKKKKIPSASAIKSAKSPPVRKKKQKVAWAPKPGSKLFPIYFDLDGDVWTNHDFLLHSI